MIGDEKARSSKRTCTATICFSWACALIITLLAGDVSLVRAALENPKDLEGAWRLSRQSEEGEWATLELRVLDHKLVIDQT